MVSHEFFADSMQAKRFLVSSIVAAAHRENEPLSDQEEKMLYFSENYPTLPDMMKIAERFEAEVNSEGYEAKITRLSKIAYEHDCVESPEKIRQWKEAFAILEAGDHYILVMLYAPGSAGNHLSHRSAADILRLILTAIGLIALMMAVFQGMHWLDEHVHGDMRNKVVMLGLAICLAIYYFSTTKVGKKTVDWLLEQLALKLFDKSGR